MKSFAVNAGFAFLLIAAPLAPVCLAQTVGQDMKQAGHDLAKDTKKTGKAVGHAATRTGEKVKHGTNRVVHKSATKNEKGAARVKKETAK